MHVRRRVLQRYHHFEIFGFLPAETACAVETPVERNTAFPPISLTVPLNFCLGMASIEDFRLLTSCTLTMSLLVHLHLRGDQRSVRNRHQGATRRVLDTGTTVSPSRTGRFVMSVERRTVLSLTQRVAHPAQSSTILAMCPCAESRLAFASGHILL